MPIRKSNDTLFYLIGIVPVVWLALLLAQSLGGGLPEPLRNLTSALEQPTNIVWTDKSLPTILICLAAYGMAVLLYRTNQGRTRDGEEHGSAAWATPASVNAQFAQKDSIPLTQHVRLGLDTHKHRRSLNVLVIGGSGAAKTRSFVLPNILTANTNYVITDPKSEVLLATGGYLKEQGYDVRVLNLVNLEQSDGYNPFRYLRDEKDVLKLVNNLIQSTTPKGSHESDPFWTKAETALLQAIILMLFQEAPEYEQNFSMVMRVLEYAEVREEDEGHVSPLDLLFESIERRKPDSVAVRQYKVFKLAAGVVCSKRLLNQAVGKSLRTHNPKSKKGAQVMRKNEKITALYERLSRDDFGKDDDQQRESNSISNQKRILEKYCRDHGYTAIRHYDEDDGYSGTNFNRPGFQRMLADIKAGKIKRVVVKDMSRFGRNYLQVGMYTEMLFPEYGVHFIAVNDGVDSVHGDSYPHGKIYPSSAVYRLTFPTLFCIVCMGGYLPALRLKSLRAVFAFTEVRK